MPRKKKVDAAKLIKAVESGLRSTDIMTKFGLKTSAQLKAAYLDALVDQGQAKAISGVRGRKASPEKKTNQIVVNKRGSLVIPRKMVEEFGFAIGEAFSARRTKAGVSLKKS